MENEQNNILRSSDVGVCLNVGKTFDSEEICDVGFGVGLAVEDVVVGLNVLFAAIVVSCGAVDDVFDDEITVVGSSEGSSVSFSEVTCGVDECDIDFSVVLNSVVFCLPVKYNLFKIYIKKSKKFVCFPCSRCKRSGEVSEKLKMFC